MYLKKPRVAQKVEIRAISSRKLSIFACFVQSFSSNPLIPSNVKEIHRAKDAGLKRVCSTQFEKTMKQMLYVSVPRKNVNKCLHICKEIYELLVEKRTIIRRKVNVVGNKIDLGIKTKVKHILNAKPKPFQDRERSIDKSNLHNIRV